MARPSSGSFCPLFEIVACSTNIGSRRLDLSFCPLFEIAIALLNLLMALGQF